MIELRKVIDTKLIALTGNSRVYFEESPQSRNPDQFPNVTFWIPTSIPNFNREDFNLEVNLWDVTHRNGYDPDDIDAITTSIDGNGDVFSPTGMDRFGTIVTSKIGVKFYRVNRLMIPDPDDRIKRRQLVYNAQVYFL